MDNFEMKDSGKRISFGEGKAFREPSTNKGRFDLISPFALKRLAIVMEKGAEKYASRNWENGMNFSRFTDSTLRHLNQFIMGMTDEDHLAHAMFNIMALIHLQELNQLEFDDMPNYLKNKE